MGRSFSPTESGGVTAEGKRAVMVYLFQILLTTKDFIYPLGIPELILDILIALYLMIALIMKVIKDQLTVKRLLIPVFVLLSYIVYHSSAFAFIFLYAYVFRGVNIKKYLLFSIIIRMLFITLSFLLLVMGYTTDTVTVHSWKSNQAAHTFGMSGNSNNAAYLFFVLILYTYTYARIEKNLVVKFACHAAALTTAAVVYYFTLSRTTLLAELALYFVGFFIRRHKTRMACLAMLLPVFLVFTSFALALFADNPFFNVLLTGRPHFWHIYLTQVAGPASLIVGSKSPAFTVDNSYLRFYMQGGLVGILFFLGVYLRFFRKINTNALWRKYRFFFPAIVAIAVAGFSETVLPIVGGLAFLFFVIVTRIVIPKLETKDERIDA